MIDNLAESIKDENGNWVLVQIFKMLPERLGEKFVWNHDPLSDGWRSIFKEGEYYRTFFIGRWIYPGGSDVYLVFSTTREWMGIRSKTMLSHYKLDQSSEHALKESAYSAVRKIFRLVEETLVSDLYYRSMLNNYAESRGIAVLEAIELWSDDRLWNFMMLNNLPFFSRLDLLPCGERKVTLQLSALESEEFELIEFMGLFGMRLTETEELPDGIVYTFNKEEGYVQAL